MPSNTQDNDRNAESVSQKHDADSGNDGSSNNMLQKENLIDPGNEHHHHDQKDQTDNYRKHDADAGGDGTGTAGPEPGEGPNEAPDVSGEDG